MGEYLLKELDHLLGFVDRLGCIFIIIQINCRVHISLKSFCFMQVIYEFTRTQGLFKDNFLFFKD